MTDELAVNPTLVHYGVDWITLTSKGGNRALNLFEGAQVLIREAISEGNDKRPWSMSGFHGWKAAHVQCGTREDEVIVRLSSDTAREHWRLLYADADNCTRIDVQATYRLACEVGPIIDRHYNQAKRHNEGHKRAPTLSKLSTNNGPCTVYLNRRISESFGRIYDKGAESKLDHLKRCIRYEVEYKGGEARRISAYLDSQAQPDICAALLAIEYMERKAVRLGKAQICYEPPWRVPLN